jgi:hypothetical protein
METHYTTILQFLDIGTNITKTITWLFSRISIIIAVFLTVSTVSVTFAVYYMTKGYKGTKIDSPTLPFEINGLKDAFAKEVLGSVHVAETSAGHNQLATARKAIERFCINFCFRYSRRVRDIGGSMKRNQDYGKKLHVCFPDITPADHAHRQSAVGCRNDAVFHTMQECDWHQMSVMTYVDFHISLNDLADHITAPTLMVTHDFAAMSGDFSWFDGECEGVVTKDLVTMTTRMGETYAHPYHAWKNQGFISGHSGVVQYIKIGEYQHSTVYLLYPGKGDFLKSSPGRLVDAAATGFNLNGIDCCLIDDSFHFRDGDVSLGNVKATTINRVAFSMSIVKRDETYAQNLTNLLKGRMTSDKQDPNVLDYARMLVARLCDRMALKSGHTFTYLPTTVIGMSFFTRMYYGILIWVYQNLPLCIRGVCQEVVRRLIGSKKSESTIPHTWQTTITPNYEMNDLDGEGKTTEQEQAGLKIKQPFPAGGSEVNAGPDREQQCDSVQHLCQSNGECSNQSSSASVENTSDSMPGPSSRRRRNSVSSNSSFYSSVSTCKSARKPSLPRDGLAGSSKHRGKGKGKRTVAKHPTCEEPITPNGPISCTTAKRLDKECRPPATCGGVGVEISSQPPAGAIKSSSGGSDATTQQ